MRFSITAALAVCLLTGTASAQSKTVSQTETAIKGNGRYGAAGCGLGSMVFGSQPGGVQILAATTNNLFLPWQTFGITTGTSNCGPGLLAMGTKNFVDANREAVAKDISRGQGESIGALTWMNGCKDSSQVGGALQRNFGKIFPSATTSNDDVANAILDVLRTDKDLGCGQQS